MILASYVVFVGISRDNIHQNVESPLEAWTSDYFAYKKTEIIMILKEISLI